MVDRGTIYRPSTNTTSPIDPVTGWFVDDGTTSMTLVWSGPCFLLDKRIQNPSARAVAEDYPFSEVASLLMPSDTPQVRVQDIFVLDSAPDHPQDVGTRFRITFFKPGTQLKARECQMETITG